MYLIHTSTFQLYEFSDRQVPRYAILSHRWEHEEVSFQDFKAGKGPSKAGWVKIAGCCAQAARDGWEYAWVDSCCIDKSSSAELSEAINSMFRWYRDAEVCYVYLSDVRAEGHDDEATTSQIRGSQWFTRGWTLQELIAPYWVEFYDHDWRELGTKSSLSDLIESITGINYLFNYEKACVAQKLSWASRRQTTRVEDEAYCLLGLLGVFMPPLYGEGKNAFRRLQLEFIKQTDDDSIFAWNPDKGPIISGLIAHSVRQFEGCERISRLVYDRDRPPITMTNLGLRLEILTARPTEPSPTQPIDLPSCSIILNCVDRASEAMVVECEKFITIPIYSLGSPQEQDGTKLWFRIRKGLGFTNKRPDSSSKHKRLVFYTDEFGADAEESPSPDIVHVRISSNMNGLFPILDRSNYPGSCRWTEKGPNCYSYALSRIFKGTDMGALLIRVESGSSFVAIMGHIAHKFRVGFISDFGKDTLEETMRKVSRGQDALEGTMGKLSRIPDRRLGQLHAKMRLTDGTSMTISAKKQMVDGRYCYVVDIKINSSAVQQVPTANTTTITSYDSHS